MGLQTQKSTALGNVAVLSGYVQRWDKLNDRQRTVLQRIGKGLEPVSAKTPELANTVYALRDRGLVTTPRKDGVWQAEITDTGRFYLDHGYHPDRPTLGRASSVATPTPTTSGRRSLNRGPISVAEELLKRLQNDGGTVVIENPDEETRACYRRAIHAAKQHSLVPAGFQLRHTGRNGGDLIIRLLDDAHPDETDWNRIRLGARDKVTDTGALVEMLRNHPEVLAVSESLMPRALELVRSLAEAARRRGHKLAMSKKRKTRGLYVQLATRHYPIAIKEEQDQVVREPEPEKGRRRPRYAWERIPVQYQLVPSGRLQVELTHSQHGRRDHWTDTARSQVDSKVLEIIKEIEHRAEAEEQAALAWKRRQEERDAEEERQKAAERARWEAAVAQARGSAIDDYRNRTFADALGAWAAATEIREFCAALERASGDYQETGEAMCLQSWVGWGRSLADRLDPVRNPSQLAQADFDAEPAPDDLRPYLGDWSPYGPHKEYYRPQSAQRAQVSDTDHESRWRGYRGRSQWWRQ
ncbi:hypothetical protein Sme01_62810 [Sphaerisporangium melleum]|uniref:PE-PGRS family protein n=1 Tax=Sphaerisporangium melleum TaxID=321316 RepID=A0A917R131_9ACTN|nr:hypothetical protein [Sphaerisporangium melleum]GGK81786.1 hypothetical protein GCM10007964_25540 [Sphaerisporangium melleum]GII73805.1 hypothetical protein Sme01_62810 [Sphaerisporangium melleum]